MSVPRRNCDPPTPSPASKCVRPPPQPHPPNQRRGGGVRTPHSPVGEGVRESQFGRLDKKPINLSTLCQHTWVFGGKQQTCIYAPCYSKRFLAAEFSLTHSWNIQYYYSIIFYYMYVKTYLYITVHVCYIKHVMLSHIINQGTWYRIEISAPLPLFTQLCSQLLPIATNCQNEALCTSVFTQH